MQRVGEGGQGEGETGRQGELQTDIRNLTSHILPSDKERGDLAKLYHSTFIHLPESTIFPLVTIRQTYIPVGKLLVFIC